MKNSIYLLVFFISSFTITAQVKTKNHNKEKFRAYKVAFLTEKLDLTAQEAQEFWPIYNAFDKKKNELRYKERYLISKEIKAAGGLDALSEKQAKDFSLRIINSRKDAEKLTTNFYNKLPKIIPYKKIIKLEIAEKSFHSKLIRKLRSKQRSKK